MTEKAQTIIRSPRGSARREVPIGQIKVPDLWDLARQLREVARAAGVVFDFEAEHHINWSDAKRLDQTMKVEMSLKQAAEAADDVLECWNLCHDLLANLRGDVDPTPDAGPEFHCHSAG